MKISRCVVENNIDPLKLGRVQIRIIGSHTENRTDTDQNSYLATDDLPWADCMFPVTSKNISGECDFDVPANGSVCICQFLDYDEQKPVIMGTLARVVEELPDFEQGFSDPNSINPIVDLVGESQISRLARNENIADTIIQTKIDGIKVDVDCNGTLFTEPVTEYATVYPENRVIQTQAGHIIELDSTPDAERIHIYHNSGTFDEYHSEGSKVENIKGTKTTIIISDNNISVEGSQNIRIGVDENKEIVGNESRKVGGAQTIDIVGDVSIATTGGTISLSGSGDAVLESTGGTLTLEGSGNVSLESTSTGKITIANGSQNLFSILDSILATLSVLKTFGSPTNHVIDPGDAAALLTEKTNLALLMQ